MGEIVEAAAPLLSAVVSLFLFFSLLPRAAMRAVDTVRCREAARELGNGRRKRWGYTAKNATQSARQE